MCRPQNERTFRPATATLRYLERRAFPDPDRGRPGAPDSVKWPWRGGTFAHFEGDTFLPYALDLLLRQPGVADKVAFVQTDEGTQASLDRRGILVQLMAVERIAHLGAQRVARAQSTGPEAD